MTIPPVAPEEDRASDSAARIVVVGLEIPLGDLMMLLIKLVFASIPAGILAAVLYFMVRMWLESLS